MVSGQLSVISCLLLAATFCLCVEAQKIAVFAPEKNGRSEKFSEKLATALSAKFKVLDASLSETAFLAAETEKPFNLTTDEAKTIGATIGGEFFVLVKSENLRRFSFEKKEYFESYAAVFAVSTRTGRLVFWKLQTFSGYEAASAEKLLDESAAQMAKEIAERLAAIGKEELNEKREKLAEPPDENSPDAKNFRAPLPYRRISPKYTPAANLYGVAATVDIEVDFDAEGKITRTEIVRWAGFGLDESVAETVRRMNWRPAMRDGKALPIRVLLRYNFKKIEKEE